MHTYVLKSLCNWRMLLVLALLPALANCHRMKGSAELRDSAGAPYSFDGANVDFFELNAAAVLRHSRTSIGNGTAAADGSINVNIVADTIDTSKLYGVEFHCPANNNTDACNVESPLTVILDGTQLKAGGWKATALTETAFQNSAYYVATGYSIVQIQQMLDRYAKALLLDIKGAAPTYANLLSWGAAKVNAVRRPHFLSMISEALAEGRSNNDIHRLTRHGVGPNVAQLDLENSTGNATLINIKIANGHAYLLDNNAVLKIVDISDPEQPVLVGQLSNVWGNDLEISGNYLYTLSTGRVVVIDISNPQQPSVLSSIFLDYDVEQLVMGDKHLYVYNMGHFYIVDISNPARPALAGSVSGGGFYIAAFGDIVALDNGSTGVSFFDTSNPATTNRLSTLELADGDYQPYVGDVKVSAEYAYALTGDSLTGRNELQIIDIRDPRAPTVTAALALPTAYGSLVLSATQAYFVAPGMILTVDMSDPTAPKLISNTNAPTYFYTLAVADDILYTLNETSLALFDMGRATGPVVQSASLDLDIRDRRRIVAADDRAYVIGAPSYFAAISIIDASNPVVPSLITTYSSYSALSSAAIAGEYVLEAYGSQQALWVTDVSNPSQPVTLENPLRFNQQREQFEGPVDIALSGNYAYLPWRSKTNQNGEGAQGCSGPAAGPIGGLFVVDVSAPAAPLLSGHVCIEDRANIVTASGDRAYVALGSGLLQIVDTTNPTSPALSGSVQLMSAPNFLAVNGNHLWANEGNDGIEIVDISDPAAPVVTSHIDTTGTATSVTFDEHYAYVAGGVSGLLMFDISNPATPVQVASAETKSAALSLTIIKKHIYTATTGGVEIFKALPGDL